MKRYEISLWDNCKNHCAFCWTARSPKANNLIIDQQIASVNQAIEIINSVKEDDILITGGELFDTMEPQLIESIKTLLETLFAHFRYNNNHFFIITNLINTNPILFDKLFNEIKNFPDKSRFHLTTSYDVVGRFHTKETEQEFFTNLNKLGQLTNANNVIVNTILTSSACNKIINDEINIFDLETKYHCVWNVIPFVSNIKEETPTKKQVFDALKHLEDQKPGFSKRFYPDLVSHTENVALKLNGKDQQNATAKLNDCGHAVNYTHYCSDSNSCFLCDVDEFFNVTQKRNGFISMELWPDCSIGCPFCFNINEKKHITSVYEKLDIINRVYQYLLHNHYSYETLQILGGEFFNGEIDDPLVFSAFSNLIKLMNHIAVKYNKRIFIYSALKGLNHFDDIMTLLLKDVKQDQVTLNSSFNYKTVHFIENKSYDEYLNNIKDVKNKYPLLKLHIQSLMTNQLITTDFNEIKKIYKPFIDLGIEIDFHPITIIDFNSWENCDGNEFRELLKTNRCTKDFAIQHRSDALNFIQNALDYFGIECIKHLTKNTTRPDTKWMVKRDLFQNDLSISPIHCDNKCGHTYHLANAYLDSDNCMSCDVITLLNVLGV